MNMKEAIDEVYQVFYMKYGKFGNQKADDIISLLQQGEKYRQMWEEMEGRARGYFSPNLLFLMEELKQKYPKKVKQEDVN